MRISKRMRFRPRSSPWPQCAEPTVIMTGAALDPAWSPFFETAAEASAGLVGLVIVAISVNIRPILDQPHLPSRAGATIGALVLIMLGSLAALIPQSLGVWGGEMLGNALVIWLQHLL